MSLTSIYTHTHTHIQMKRQSMSQAEGQIDRRKDVRIEEQTERYTDGEADRWTYG